MAQKHDTMESKMTEETLNQNGALQSQNVELGQRSSEKDQVSEEIEKPRPVYGMPRTTTFKMNMSAIPEEPIEHSMMENDGDDELENSPQFDTKNQPVAVNDVQLEGIADDEGVDASGSEQPSSHESENTPPISDDNQLPDSNNHQQRQ